MAVCSRHKDSKEHKPVKMEKVYMDRSLENWFQVEGGVRVRVCGGVI